jgi:hypothetical protein
MYRLEQQTYMHLLQRYLETTHSTKCEAKTRFLKLMRLLQDLYILREKHNCIKLDIDLNDMEPLLIEFYDVHKNKSNFKLTEFK